MKKKRWRSRFWAMFAVLAMVCSMLLEPLTVLADGETAAAHENHLTVTPSSETVHATIGESKTLTVTVSGDDLTGLTYEWLKRTQDPVTGEYNFIEMEGAKESCVTGALTEAVTFICHVYDRFGNHAMGWFDVVFENHLTVTPNYENYNVTYGASKTLQVTASADDVTGLTYQWYKTVWNETAGYSEQVKLEGANQSSYTTEAITERADFQCWVSDRYGNSAYASFTVNPENHLTVSPNYETVFADYGTSKKFTVTVSADDVTGLTYQWKKAAWDPTTERFLYGEDIPGATGKSYTVETLTDSALYSCLVKDRFGNVEYGNFAVYLDNHLTVAPNYETVIVDYGTSKKLTVTVNADDMTGLTYRWMKSTWDSTAGRYLDYEEIPGATGKSYTTEAVTNRVEYQCAVMDRFGNRKDGHFIIGPENHLTATPSYESYTVTPGTSKTLTVTATATDATGITYQWYENVWNDAGGYYEANKIEGANQSSYTTAAITEGKRFQCTVTDRFGNPAYCSFNVTLDNHLTVTPNYETLTVDYGTSKKLTVTVSADDLTGLTYRWMKGSWDSATGSFAHYEEIPGANGKSYTVSSVTERATYECIVTDRFGSTKYGLFNVGPENHLTATPSYQSYAVTSGTSKTLTVTATATDATGITYQWYENVWNDAGGYYEANKIEGANQSSYTTAAITEGKRFQCTVTDRFGNPAYCTFIITLDNHLTVTPNYEFVSVAIGEKKTLTVTVSADDVTGLKYQWMKASRDPNTGYYGNYEEIAGATKKSYTTEALTEAHVYCCRVEDRYGNTVYGNYEVCIDNHLTVSPENKKVTAAPGESKTLTVTVNADDLTGLKYQWVKYPWDSASGTFQSTYEVITGATKKSYVTGPISEAVMYACCVTDCYGTMGYAYFTVGVENHLNVAASRSTVTVEYGSGATISVIVSADDVTGLKYRWEKYGVNPVTGEYESVVFDEVNSNSLTVDSVTNSANYACYVSDRYGNDGTAYMSVRVANRLQVMPLTTKTEYKSGEKATLRVKVGATDASGLTYRWSRNRYEFDEAGNYTYVYENLEGSSDTFVTEKVTGSWYYYCEVTDRYGSTASAGFQVNEANHFRVSKTSGYYVNIPQNGTSRITVKIMADNPNGIRYVWQKDGVVLKNGSENYLDVQEAGQYECSVIDSYGKCVRQYFEARMENHFAAEADGNAEKIVKKGGDVTLKVNVQADDKSSLHYDWYQIGDGSLDEWGWANQYNSLPMEGNGASLKLTNVTKQGKYSCIVSDQYGNESSVTFDVYVEQKSEVTVSANKGTISDSPYNSIYKTLTVPSGETVKIQLAATGFGSDVKYCWREYGNNGMADYYYNWYRGNDTSNTITIKAVSDGVMHCYECCVTDGQGRYQWISIDVVATDLVINYDANGGTGTMAQVASQSGIMYFLPECEFTAPLGKTFAGWEINGKLYETDELILLYGDATAKATWKDAEQIALTFRHNVEFDNNIAMHYVVLKEALKDYSDLKLVIDKEVYEKNVATPTIKRCVLENPTTYYIGEEEYWHFVFPGVAASEMGNILEAQLICSKDGVNYASKKETYSVKAYAYDRLKNTTKATYRTLLVDMLNYGAAAQIHFGKNAANPVNANLTATQKKYASSWDDVEITQTANLIELNGATAFFDKKNVMFDNKVELAYLITFSSNQKMDNVKIVFKYNNGKGEKTLTVPASKFEKNGNAYVAYCDCLTPAEMGCTVSATIYDGSKAISGTLQYGIEAYAADRLLSSTSTTYKDLMKKMVMYGRATKAHFGK